VHTHNLAMTEYARDYAFCVDARPTEYVAQPATFMGIVRPDGRVATRNYIGILTSVNCSATVARAVADYFRATSGPRRWPIIRTSMGGRTDPWRRVQSTLALRTVKASPSCADPSPVTRSIPTLLPC
jgi:hypothetical protein